MKIGELGKPSMFPRTEKAGKEEIPQGVEFQKILQEARARTQGCNETAPQKEASSAGPVQDPLAVNVPYFEAIREADPSLKKEGVQTLEKAMLVLDQYQNSLADARVSLKEIFPLIQSMQEGTKGLSEMAGKFSVNDPLRGLLAETGILVAVEVEKYNRGDYLS